MPRTSQATSRNLRRRSGFTLIELAVVCIVLIAIAAIVTPRLSAMEQSRRLKDTEASIARLPLEARNKAVSVQSEVRLRIDGQAMVMEQVQSDGTAQTLKQIDLGSDIQVDRAQQNGQSTDTGSWQWSVYADGSADSAGVEFAEGSLRRSLVMTKSGAARWITGDLPDQSQDSWPAGNLMQRGGTSSAG